MLDNLGGQSARITELDGARVLIVQPFLFRLAGSEVVALELAAVLESQGAQVSIATWGWSENLAAAVGALRAVDLLQLGSQEFDDYARIRPPDLVWSHQGLLPPQAFREWSGQTRFVFAHLSSFNPFENPFVPLVEQTLADALYFVSPETEEVFLSGEVLEGIDPDRAHVFGNPAPAQFHQDLVPVRNGELTSVLVVSNHLPRELIGVVDALKSKGIRVTVAGVPQAGTDAKPMRVDPDLLASHDCVVTIGKTVQYALCGGVPVYCYDYFGGPGWLSPDNFEVAAHHNFSGRGFEQRSTEQVQEELVAGFLGAQAFAESVVPEARQRFTFDRTLETLGGVLSKQPRARAALPGPVVRGYRNAHEAVRDFGVAYYAREAELAATKQHVVNLEAIIATEAGHVTDGSRGRSELEAHIRHLEQMVVQAHEHISAMRPSARLRRAWDRVVASARRVFGQ